MILRRLILVLTASLCAAAHPLSLVRRTEPPNDPNNNANNPSFIIAGAVLGGLLLVVAGTTLYRMRKARQVARANGPATTTTQSSAQAVLSANPSATNLASTTPATDTGTNSNRRGRPRRTRRTPSQISTKSLPAYMEQPGDEELVLVQRTAEHPRGSMDAGERSTYESRSSSDVQTPLMQEVHTSVDQDDEGADDDESRISSRRSGHQVNMSIDSVATGSGDTHGSRNSTSQLLTSADGAPPVDAVIDERGEAPPYTETEHTDPSASISGANNNAGSTTGAHRSVASRIMPSGLRNLFSGTLSRPQSQVENPDSSVPMVAVTGTPAVNGSDHRRTRADTETTVPDSASFPALLLSRSRSPSSGLIALSRPLTSNSSSTSLHGRFTHQRNRSGSSLSPSVINNAEGSNTNARLTSPSSASINISSPLVHTVTRTEFRFPKSGPTPEQLKFLSSRESLGRFGVPFGEDAERNYPNARPPPFEATPGASSSRPGTSGSNSENNMTGTEEPAPARGRPASWWRNLTQPLRPHDPTAGEPAGESLASVAAAPEPESGSAADAIPPKEATIDDDNEEFEPASLVPLPPSARQSLALPPSVSLSNQDDDDDDDEGGRSHHRLSRAYTVSSAHTNATYQTAVDTMPTSSSSETGYHDDDDEEAPATPTMIPQRSLPPPSSSSSTLSIREDIGVPRPPVPSDTTVSVH